MKNFLFILSLCISFSGCAQNKSGNKNETVYNNVGGPCEGCEAIHESPIPFSNLNYIDTLPGFENAEQKIAISGVVYERDGKTPAKNVVLYVYHTNEKGIYPTKGNEKNWDRRHGYIRGWMKTDAAGRYKFYTFKPGSYPGGGNPAHIHITVKEPDKNEYWISDFLFIGDPYLSPQEKNKNDHRGGNGILELKPGKEIMTATRNIFLGLHVTNYPALK